MIKNLLSFLLLAFIVMACQEVPKERMVQTVISHDHTTIVCNPLRGNNEFLDWGVFPSKEVPVRRVFMNVALGHPDSINIAHWDYLDPIRIKRVGGQKGDTLDLEIGKMLTPYGSNFKKDWRWNWRIDVTDFSEILRDSVEIEYNHSGYEAESVGWDLSISFDLELGDPIAEQTAYKEIYDGSFAYGNPDKPIAASLAPQEVRIDQASDFGRLRILHTGHGADRPKGCSEFCSRWREVLVDGNTIDHRDMWKECGDNNLYPQGGTWIFDRAYWCPGDLQHPDLIDFKLTKDSHTIDLEMEPYTATDNIQANEMITAVLFQYKEPAKANDVAIDQILVPNKAVELNRLNPSAKEPVIKIKNLGKETLTELTIVYGTRGFKQKEYQWKGALEFYQETLVTLPGIIDFNHGENTFFVVLQKPNGQKDGWLNDNLMESSFRSPKEMPQELVVTYKSNSFPEDNTISITNTDGKSFYSKLPKTTKKDHLYRDTLKLEAGHYRMILQDSTHTGLEFWFLPQQGFGYLQLSDLKGRVLHRFESDCGVGEQLDFTVKADPQIDLNVEQSMFKLHPRLTKDKTMLYVQLEKMADGEIHVLKDGEVQEKIPVTGIKDDTITVDMSAYEDGRYVIEFFVEGESKLKQRISKYTKPRF